MTSSITKFRIHLRRASRNAINDLRKNVPKFTNRKLRTIRTLRYEKQAPVDTMTGVDIIGANGEIANCRYLLVIVRAGIAGE